jgi:hypothetical protein
LEKLVSVNISLHYDKRKGRFHLTVNEMCFTQNICEFLLTNSFLVGKDIEEYLFNVEGEYDSVKIPLTSTGKVITLDLVEFIRFKDVYHQQMYLLKLEDMLIHRGVSFAAAV